MTLREQFKELEQEVDQYKDDLYRKTVDSHPKDYIYSVYSRPGDLPFLEEHPIVSFRVKYNTDIEQPRISARMHPSYLGRLERYYAQLKRYGASLIVTVAHGSGTREYKIGKYDYPYYSTFEEADEAYSTALEAYDHYLWKQENNIESCAYCNKELPQEEMIEREIIERGVSRMVKRTYRFCSGDCAIAAQKISLTMKKSISEINLGTKFRLSKSKTSPLYVKGKFSCVENSFLCCLFDDMSKRVLIERNKQIYI